MDKVSKEYQELIATIKTIKENNEKMREEVNTLRNDVARLLYYCITNNDEVLVDFPARAPKRDKFTKGKP